MIVFILVTVCLAVSLLFNSLGTISLYRFPDVYSRLHGATKCTTFGTIFTAFALIIFKVGRHLETGEPRFRVFIVHALVAVMVLLLTNATGAHAIARAAHRSGLLPAKAVVDRLEEKEKGGASL